MDTFFSYRFFYRLVLIFLISIVLAGCGTKTTVVLLPDNDGKIGAVTVANDEGSVDIETANQATTVQGRQSKPRDPHLMATKDIETVFGKALSAQPQPPVHFILYFVSGSNKLRTESLDSIPQILKAIKDRHSADITVVGHTDTAGSDDYNYSLSKKRAEAVSDILVKSGVQAEHIKSTSHGEENPLVKTGNNVSEPKNRRVEVVVR